MPETLLRTKLYVPALQPNLVPRLRLIDQLNQGLQLGHRFTLISAPAGFGKTTLLSSWVQQSEWQLPVAWLSLDEGDSDLPRFLTYFVAALQAFEDSIGQGGLVAFQSPGAVNIEAVLTTLLNEIAELPDDVVLILDDYHLIESRLIDDALTFFLEHLPPQMHLVIASRIDPSLPLPRLRARGQMTEMRVDDLRFSLDEGAAFLHQAVGFELSWEDAAALESRTEGWIAGLQLAALSMRGFERSSDIVDFISRFTGSDRYIHDYLTDEVLQQQPKATRDFLLQTSILNRLSAPLCDAVRFGDAHRPSGSIRTNLSGENDSQAILESLEAANLFIVPLDNERRWYRYHHLFAGLLAHRLNQRFADRIGGLHQRASLWYENAGFLDDAILHAKATGDDDRVADILEEHWQDIVHRGEATKLRRLLDSLDPEFIKNSTPLSMAYCWIHVLTGDVDSIPRRIKDIKRVLAEGTDTIDARQPIKLAVIPSLVETMEATVSLETMRARQAKAHALSAIALIPSEADPAVRKLLQGAASYRLALAHKELGEYDQACAVFLVGLEMLKASDNYFGAAVSVLQIVNIYQEQEKTREAITLCEDTLKFIKQNQWQKMPPSGMVQVALAGLQADAGYDEAADRNLELGRKLLEQIESRYTIDLINNVESKLGNAPPPPQPLVEPLSPRELEVLQLIADGLTNREISQRLFLALDTVKGHNRKIYGKLGVKNRTQAVNKAISLKIMPTP